MILSNGCADGFCEPVREDVPFERSYRLHMKVGRDPEHGFVMDATVLRDDPATARVWIGSGDEPTEFFFTADAQTLESASSLLATLANVVKQK